MRGAASSVPATYTSTAFLHICEPVTRSTACAWQTVILRGAVAHERHRQNFRETRNHRTENEGGADRVGNVLSDTDERQDLRRRAKTRPTMNAGRFMAHHQVWR